MAEFNFSVNGGDSIRLKTAGKYCDRDIVVTGSGGSGKLFLHKRFETAAEMRAQPSIPMGNGESSFTLYKFFNETPTIEEIIGAVAFISANYEHPQTLKHIFMGIEDAGVAWGIMDSVGLAYIMCVFEEGAEAMGVEAGIYFSEEFLSDAKKPEIYIIGE